MNSGGLQELRKRIAAILQEGAIARFPEEDCSVSRQSKEIRMNCENTSSDDDGGLDSMK